MAGRVDEQAQSAGRRVVREVGAATRLLRGLMAPPLQAAGITQAEFHLLAYLEESGTSTGKELSCTLSLDKTTVSRQLTALEEAGAITRTTDPANRRSHLITLTDAGRERLADARRRTIAVLEDRFSSWPAGELDVLAAQLARFNDQLRGTAAESEPPVHAG
ncbi:MarR family winged helix-turn-helix transcriptional regulator [Yinghuangia seranimata]|uniref:MarR family winged helix-turn-helix transcriptional regulator n=1 Tax=Yinghuangia seranimata TaxID=408067 RepID=UPI00248C468F|nr:MarR family transcriptional regulator [Yinghuangia seranimata]MDI2132574.1 MarR family transcriptional regulator [Yinghuangia seranimata]